MPGGCLSGLVFLLPVREVPAVCKGEILACPARAEAWSDPQTVKAHAREAIELHQKTGNLIDEQEVRVILPIASAETDSRQQQAKSLNTGNRSGVLRVLYARVWQAVAQNGHNGLFQQIEQLAIMTGTFQHWADIVRAWLPGHACEHAQLTVRWEWLDSSEATIRR